MEVSGEKSLANYLWQSLQTHTLVVNSSNRHYWYSQYWTRTRLQWWPMQGNKIIIKKKRETICISLSCMLVPVQYREYKYGLCTAKLKFHCSLSELWYCQAHLYHLNNILFSHMVKVSISPKHAWVWSSLVITWTLSFMYQLLPKWALIEHLYLPTSLVLPHWQIKTSAQPYQMRNPGTRLISAKLAGFWPMLAYIDRPSLYIHC